MNYYFVARIELNNHDEGDYEQLHKALEGILFYRFIQGIEKGYNLPAGEYVRISDNTIVKISKLISTTLDAFIGKNPSNSNGQKKDYEFLLSRSENLYFKLKG